MEATQSMKPLPLIALQKVAMGKNKVMDRVRTCGTRVETMT